MNDINWQHIKAGFAREFRPEEIGTAPGNKGGGAYVDARSIDERLDEVAGPENWSVSYRIIDLAAGVVEATITVHGISKSDVGYPNNTMGTLNKSGNLLEPEPMKAAYSDAIKRAAVHWGIGRYLYPYASKRQRAGSDHEEPQNAPKPPATPPQNGSVDKPTFLTAMRKLAQFDKDKHEEIKAFMEVQQIPSLPVELTVEHIEHLLREPDFRAWLGL